MDPIGFNVLVQVSLSAAMDLNMNHPVKMICPVDLEWFTHIWAIESWLLKGDPYNGLL